MKQQPDKHKGVWVTPRHFAPVLTPREAEVAALVKRGFRRKEIAVALRIATRTVDSFLVRIKLKTKQPKTPKQASDLVGSGKKKNGKTDRIRHL